MGDIVKDIASLSSKQQDLLKLLLEQEGLDILQLPITPQKRDSNSFPASFAQQRLWFLAQLEPNSSSYNIPSALRLVGQLDVVALESSLNEILRRHEALRTTFQVVDGEPRQVITSYRPTGLTVESLQACPANERDAHAQQLASEEAQRPFDLARGPLVRFRLLQLGQEDHVLLLTMHHTVSDGWSMGVLVRELRTLYEVFLAGKPSLLPELPIQYADYAIWQRQWLQGQVLESQLDYWKRQLAGSPPLLELPTDRARPAVQSFRGTHHEFVLPGPLSVSLGALSRQEDVTLFMTLLAAFDVLLHRYTGQDDVLVGSPIANRNRAEIEELIGFFVNTLVLRVDLSGNPTFRELLGRVRRVTLEAYDHQDMPFERLVEELQPTRDLSHNPLFQVLFQLQNAPGGDWELPGLRVGRLEIELGMSPFDWAVSFWEEPDGLSGLVEYNTDLFDATTITRMTAHYQTLLESIVANPDRPIADLPILTDVERDQILAEWDGVEIDPTQDVCVHHLFEKQVERTPEAVAVSFKDDELSYRDLNAGSNQVAHALRDLGVEPQQPVAVLLESGPQRIMVLMGILKAGCAFVCLDPAHPAERLRQILKHVSPPCLISESVCLSHHLQLLPQFCRAAECQVIVMDRQAGQKGQPELGDGFHGSDYVAIHPSTNLPTTINPVDPAYVAYTSGSTGRPKGIVQSHRSLEQFVHWFSHQFDIRPSKRIAQWVSITFDPAYAEIFAALCSGATLCLVNTLTKSDPTTTARWLKREKISHLQVVPSFSRQLLQVIQAEENGHHPLPDLEFVLLAGEVIPVHLMHAWLEHFPRQPKFFNLYGPTEAIVATCYPVEAVGLDQRSIPIGRAIDGSQVLILDQQQNLCPIGVKGELYIRGRYLTLGYFRRPEETQRAFVQNPLHSDYPDPVYRTGDLGRWLPDGTIEFFGRVDHQVKIRGMRVELEDIEAVLSKHQSVKECAVIVQDYGVDDQQLVAYVKASDDLSPSLLRDYLSKQLPVYMVPAMYVLLEALPHTISGKIDRKALPRVDKQQMIVDTAYVAPQTPVENGLAEIWQELLHIAKISVQANFFDLGGHSLLATQVMSRVRNAFQVELPLRKLFEGPSIAKLAREVETTWRAQQGVQSPPLVPTSREGNLPLSFAQQRLWFLTQLEPNSGFYNIPRSLRLVGQLDVAALENSLSEIVRRHEALRTTFRTVDSVLCQVIAPSHPMSLTIESLQEWPESEREERARQLASEEAQRPFDLARGPLVRFRLLKLDREDHVLLLTVHHIVSDGWSTGVLVRELRTLYEAFLAGKPSLLPELPIQYADYAIWQRQWLQGQVLESQLDYWKHQLAGAPLLTELPTDRARPAIQSFRGTYQDFMLPRALSESLQALSRREGVTLFMTLLAAFQTLLYRYTRQTDIVVGSPIAGRHYTEIETLIGFLANMLVLRTDLSGEPTFRGLLRRVREVMLGAYSHQDLPFEKLVEELQPERNLSHSPLFQVVFTLQNAPMKPLELSGLTLSPLEAESGVVRYDLALAMVETDEGLGGTWEYSTDLFDTATIVQMQGHLQTLLEGIVANPEQHISNLPLLTEAEKQRLLVDWNDTQLDYPRDMCVQHVFEDRVKQSPDAIAVAFESRQLSYAGLNARANQLARYLKTKDVGPDSVVAILDDRTPEMVTALLGILKAGGAYFPIDKQSPLDRILFMLRDSKTNVLLTRDHILKDVPFTWLQGLQDVSENVVVTDTRPQIKDLNALPFPDRSLVDYRKYNQYQSSNGYVNNNISIGATRGCPYKCAYCHKLWPKTHVVRSAQNIFEEVQFHYDKGYRTFSFWDDIFNLDRRNSEAFFKLVVENKMKMRILFPNGVRGDILTPSYIDLMAEAGVVQMGIALETASPRLQRLIGKNLKIEKVRASVEYICKKYPHIILDLLVMLGFPTETEEEALMTLDFVEGIKWLHFPVLSILKIFPNTPMAHLAVEHGVTEEAIKRCAHLPFHELSDTLPFPKSFARECQSRYLANYFLLPERLESVIPFQKQSLTRDGLIARYNNYLPNGIESYPEIIRLIGDDGYYSEDSVPDENGGRENGTVRPAPLISVGKGANSASYDGDDGLRILLLDLSQHFSSEAAPFFNPVEAPLGLMYLLTYLNREFGSKIQGKILKSMVDFDGFEELRNLLDDFRPQVIGIRTLSLYKDFFHEAVSLIKQWYPDVLIISGGPYATSEYTTILSDENVDLVVLGEGELTFSELIGEIVKRGGELPEDDVLERIAGLAFVPRRHALARGTVGMARKVLLLDKIADTIANEKTSDPESASHTMNLAYVIYTSGTTGRPKGTQIEHRSLLNLVFWHQQAFGVSGADRTTQTAGLAFDASTWELWPYLTAGASVHIPDEETRGLPEQLRDWLIKEAITISFLPTPLAESVLPLDWPKHLALRTLLTGGDRLHHYPSPSLPFELVNNYGPTEYTVVTTFGLVSPRTQADRPPSIGRPIANTRVYLLDTHLQPMPIGVPGELYIGGEGLGRGYFDRPGLTAERFVPNPFSDRPGARLYRTGDLARYLPGGNIEFLERVDHQIKILGYRIEPGEIEATLSQHPGILEVEVVASPTAREDEPGSRRLVAYWVPQDGQVLPKTDLKDFLRETLPEYMVPATFVMLEALPLTPNGKVDRQALLSPEPVYSGLTYVAPETALEQTIAEAWQEYLRLERVGLHDSFFDLGGHSLLMTQVHRKLVEQLDQDWPIVAMFKYPSVSDLAKYLSQAQDGQPPPTALDDRSDKLKAGKHRLQQLRKKQKMGEKRSS